jgi:hypothetical protein
MSDDLICPHCIVDATDPHIEFGKNGDSIITLSASS